MTELVYYKDTDLTSFTAEIVSALKTDEGFDLILSRTCFYPEGGGQPSDTGTINDLPVIDVRKKDGTVTHSLSCSSKVGINLSAGTPARGVVNREHRLDYMQQHTGQHIISAAMMKISNIATVSVHQGTEYTAIETPESEITDETLYRIEDEANSLISLNVPILAHWTDAEGLSQFNLRRPSKHSSNIRIIEIPGVDCVACGGMHLKTTGETGLVKYIRQEKIRGHIRTFWKIGRRAYADYREKTEIINSLNILHSALQHELPAKTEAAAAALSDLKFSLGKLQREYAQLFMEKLIAGAEKTPSGLMLSVSMVENKDRRFIENLMKQLASHPNPILSLVFNKTEDKTTWAAACSCDAECFDFKSFKSDLLPLIGGKGGGNSPIWQGVALNPEGLEEMIEGLRKKFAEG